MADELTAPSFIRDTELEQKMLEAVIADRNEDPRSLQREVGPSSVGFCRELLRASLFEADSPELLAPETNWAAAAHVGKVMGADLERIFGKRLGAIEQQRITAFFPMIGVNQTGSSDLIFIEDEQITDLKSTTDIGGLIYDLTKNAGLIDTLLAIWRAGELYEKSIETADGGYELTDVTVSKISKLHYYVQIAIYVTGAIQAGILEPGASGRLVFYDRAGDFQEFMALVVTPEMIEMFFDIGQYRIAQVADAQELLERTGNPYLVHHLRDQAPSFCFSPKVMCPMRERCWGGSEHAPTALLDSTELSSAADRYIEGRRLATLGDGMKRAAREELKGSEGSFSDGRMVTWKGGRISVVETAKGKAGKTSAVDAAQKVMAKHAIPTAVEPDLPGKSEPFKPSDLADPAKVEALNARGIVDVAQEYPPDPEAEAVFVEAFMEAARQPIERDPRIDRVQFRDSETGEPSTAGADIPRLETDTSGGGQIHTSTPARRGASAIERELAAADQARTATPAARVLEQNRADLTPAQIEFLERKARLQEQQDRVAADRAARHQR